MTATASKQQEHEGGSDEAARLFPQQRVLPGQNSVEPEGVERGSPAAPSSQGRTARSRLSRDQSARAGADAAGRCGRDPHPVARHHRMAGGNPSRTAAAAERSAAPRQSPRLRDGARLRYPSGAESESAGAAARARPARRTGDGLGGMGQPRGSCGLRNADRGRARPVLLWRGADHGRSLPGAAAWQCAALRRRCRGVSAPAARPKRRQRTSRRLRTPHRSRQPDAE